MSRLERALSALPRGSSVKERTDLEARLVAHRDRDDRETVEFWRNASSAEHADAMCQLAHYAEMMARQTGIRAESEPLPILADLLAGGDIAVHGGRR